MSYRIILRCVLLVAAVGSSAAFASSVPELALTHAWFVAGPDRFDASGLAISDGEFFVVSDRHHDTIFRLVFDANSDEAHAVVAAKFTGPTPYPEKGYLDLEGLALAPDGGFYVVAEWGFAVAHVPAGGGVATWVTPDLRGAAQTVGLFATPDAYLEGIAVLGDDWFLLAAERQPRGLIEVMGGNPPIRVSAQETDASNFPSRGARKLDYGDLCTWRGRVFALARNQHLVVELRRDAEGAWVEGDAWSYAETENATAHRFTDMTFGLGEGLAIDERFIYVLLDNNALAREGHPEDKRTWLFAFRNVLTGGR